MHNCRKSVPVHEVQEFVLTDEAAFARRPSGRFCRFFFYVISKRFQLRKQGKLTKFRMLVLLF